MLIKASDVDVVVRSELLVVINFLNSVSWGSLPWLQHFALVLPRRERSITCTLGVGYLCLQEKLQVRNRLEISAILHHEFKDSLLIFS